MTQPILRLEQLSKKYGKATIVDQFSLYAEKGHICGLIGPNGAGKTTVMKMMAGLTTPDAGTIRYFDDNTGFDEARRRMSFMIEAPIIDPGMTARENMEYVRYARGVPREEKIGEVLEFVGLSDTGKKLARNFSLGMKQRLGIGMALLTEPEILVLDEPVNGLDPEGIVDVRHLLKKLAEERGVTILISSHLLSELSELCSDFTLINHGKLIESFTAEELQQKCRTRLCIRTNNIEQTAALLENKLSIREYKAVHGEELHLYERLGEVETISKTITDSGLILTKLVSEGESLENYYLSKVGEENA